MGGGGKGGGGDVKPGPMETAAADIFKRQNELWAPLLGSTGQSQSQGTPYWEWVADEVAEDTGEEPFDPPQEPTGGGGGSGYDLSEAGPENAYAGFGQTGVPGSLDPGLLDTSPLPIDTTGSPAGGPGPELFQPPVQEPFTGSLEESIMATMPQPSDPTGFGQVGVPGALDIGLSGGTATMTGGGQGGYADMPVSEIIAQQQINNMIGNISNPDIFTGDLEEAMIGALGDPNVNTGSLEEALISSISNSSDSGNSGSNFNDSGWADNNYDYSSPAGGGYAW